MPGCVPLHAGWLLSGPSLPARLLDGEETGGFVLPGAEALSEFADLLGGGEDDGRPVQTACEEKEEKAGFLLPALLPEDMPGPASLSRTIDLRLACADSAQVCFDLLTGCGEALLDGETVGRFDHSPLTVDLTALLPLSRVHELTLRFDSTRPAGVSGPVLLRTAQAARLSRIGLSCDAGRGIVTLQARITALQSGDYTLRVLPCPASAAQACGQPPSAREAVYSLQADEEREIELSFAMEAARFVPGQAYAAPSVRVMLLRGSMLCDSATLMCGYAGDMARAWLPLSAQDLRLPPDQLANRISALHITGVSAARSISDPLARRLCRDGVSAVITAPRDASLARLPNIAFAAPAPRQASPGSAEHSILCAWQLGGMTTIRREADPLSTPAQLLRELAGRIIDPSHAQTQEVLAWLRTVRVRLNAEAARQGRFTGPLCAEGEWDQPDIADALRTALAPIHLSALPLYGAWWTGAHFSAALHAAVDPSALPDTDAQLYASASLEDGEGRVLAALRTPCGRAGGYVGVLEAALPDTACALTLYTSISCGDAVLEQSELPVYVGARGLLEAAFAGCI
ncbi:MAG: hypothetical protein J6K32_11375 [Clostridia bacterium]|nr:hypothetical protein [Clostridia bacterium]